VTAWSGTGTRPLVVAFGGNALLPDPDDPAEAEHRAREFAEALLLLLPDHAGLVLVHGNGPQVGAILLRVEATRDRIPPETLDVLVAETQGSIGYLLERALREALTAAGRHIEVATIGTQIVVDPSDPAMQEPSKPIGPFYSPEEGLELAQQHGWDVVEIPDRGVRRVVPSPRPLEVIEIHTIADAARHGHLVIAGGGGGIAVRRDDAGTLHGVEAVIDKDRTAGLLASSLRAGGLVILTAVPHVSTGFGSPDERPIHEMTADRADRLMAEGEFPPGSMGPKVEAAAAYAREMRRPALITSVEALPAALAGTDGTWISD
jgi:carbamate kinase